MAFAEREFWICRNYAGTSLNARSTSAAKVQDSKTDGELFKI